jgi:anti-sigma factor RsiW
MTLTDDILLRYVDGQLSAADVAAVQTALARDHVAAERVRLLQLSAEGCLIERSRPLPRADAALVARMLGSRSHPVVASSPTGASQALSRRAALAAFAALLVGFGSGWLARHVNGIEDQLPLWVLRVVDYHTLYSRETVEGTALDDSTRLVLAQRFGALLGRPVKIPTFEAGIELRRGQILRFEHEPVIQLAYLPENGMPVALCIKRVAGPDTPPGYRRVSGIGMVRWRQDGTEYVLVGDQPDAMLRQIAMQAVDQMAARP